ncbi:hypothetical protein VTJ49DRAFT_1328 [Mycothermus thermophilus]|uniref:Uncharacterized protein n=1 Tax=Humicola insolens TaxID=85995 RepID=A0ABR3VCP8_HUMIN
MAGGQHKQPFWLGGAAASMAVILVRMCADAAKPRGERFGYSDAVTGLWRIGREEGVRVFGRGMGANIARSVLMSETFPSFFPSSLLHQPLDVGVYVVLMAADTDITNAECQMSPDRALDSYAAAKRFILSHTPLQDDIRTHALASLVAGTVATTACAPADVLKSRIQSAAKGSSVMQVIRDGLSHEGPGFLMKGWTPAWLRLTPHTVLTFVFMEKLQALVNMEPSARARVAV